MFYFKNKKNGKYLDYKCCDVGSKKDAVGYPTYEAILQHKLADYDIVDENDGVILE